MLKTIKTVDDGTWVKFKTLAVKKRLTMGELLASMVREYEKRADDTWDKILHSGKILSDREAKDLHKIVRGLRKERGFRDVPDF